jgi:hypothetical protein
MLNRARFRCKTCKKGAASNFVISIVTSIILLHHAESLPGQTPSPSLARRADNYETCVKDPDGMYVYFYLSRHLLYSAFIQRFPDLRTSDATSACIIRQHTSGVANACPSDATSVSVSVSCVLELAVCSGTIGHSCVCTHIHTCTHTGWCFCSADKQDCMCEGGWVRYGIPGPGDGPPLGDRGGKGDSRRSTRVFYAKNTTLTKILRLQ